MEQSIAGRVRKRNGSGLSFCAKRKPYAFSEKFLRKGRKFGMLTTEFVLHAAIV